MAVGEKRKKISFGWIRFGSCVLFQIIEIFGYFIYDYECDYNPFHGNFYQRKSKNRLWNSLWNCNSLGENAWVKGTGVRKSHCHDLGLIIPPLCLSLFLSVSLSLSFSLSLSLHISNTAFYISYQLTIAALGERTPGCRQTYVGDSFGFKCPVSQTIGSVLAYYGTPRGKLMLP